MSEYLSALARLFGAALFPKPADLPPRAHAFDPESFPGRVLFQAGGRGGGKSARLAGQPWQEEAPAPKGAHYHYCLTPGCETALVCHAAADRCPVPNKWVCPACELDAVDAYLTAQEREPRR